MIGDRWGVTDAEAARRYPCDELVPDPVGQAWRGVTIAATSAQVWPWVTQLRVAPYSYDWIDNLGRRSPQVLLGLPEPTPGDPFTTAAGRRFGEILAVDPGRHLPGRIGAVAITYALVPDAARTRLLMKLVVPSPWFARPLVQLGCLGDLLMARRQLLNLKHLAEHSQLETGAEGRR